MTQFSSRLRIVIALCATLLIAPAGCQQVRQWVKPPSSSTNSAAPLNSSRLSQKKRSSKKDKPDASFAVARSLEQSSQLERAAKAYSEIVKDNPNYAPAHHRLAVVQVQLGQSTDADGSFEKALKLDPANPELLCDFGYCLYLKGDLDAAELQYRNALRKQPGCPRALNQLGLVLAQTDRHGEAWEHFRAAGCQPSEAHLNVAFSLMRNQQWELANQHLSQAKAEGATSQQLSERLTELQKLAGNLAGKSHSESVENRTSGATNMPTDLKPAPVQSAASQAQSPVSPASYMVAPMMMQTWDNETIKVK